MCLLCRLVENTKEKDFLLHLLLSTALVFPWTKVAIMTINNLLMDRDVPKKKGDSWVLEMMIAKFLFPKENFGKPVF